MPGAPVWEDIRRDYDADLISVPKILIKHGITNSQLRDRREAEGWAPRLNAIQSAAARKAAKSPSTPSPPATPTVALPTVAQRRAVKRSGPAAAAKPPRKRTTPIAQRRALVQRLTTAIETKLGILEKRFDKEMSGEGKATSAADTERDTRAIGILIKNLEQVTEYSHAHELGTKLSGAAAKSAARAASELADEADRLRRDLAERLQRLADAAP